ncbi:hypothetical protein TanjilG_17500 [Lupinus angustifolius]|uniref:DUF7610 domain-containing protein n=1 Tax=Lupinus angustifolius TaxID=3871 RepID=A0A4P1R1Z8_LUPAN|nr:hypothetical protein TanjilG_17500 [Lupinus angustifolius]
MAKSYSTLHAKVHELESIVDELFLLGPDTESHHSLSKDIIKQKLDFIWNLLSAEVASHPSKPHHLHHISQRLEELDKTFHQWDPSPTLSHDHDFDKDESCFNDDDKALVEFNGSDKEIDNVPSFVYEDAEEWFEEFDGDKEVVEFESDDELKREERRESALGSKCFAVVVTGMLFVAFIMVTFSDYVDQTSFPIPT